METDPLIQKYVEQYGTQHLHAFYKWYGQIHGYVAVGVCIFGIMCNVFNIVVLTRRNMVSPFNIILTGLAVSDMMTMTSYTVFALHFYCLHSHPPNAVRNSAPWVGFMLFHVHFSLTTHNISIFLAVLLALFRYAFVRLQAPGGSVWSSTNKAAISVGGVYVASIILMIPTYMSQHIIYTNLSSSDNSSYYEIHPVNNNTLFTVNFWIHALLFKIIPCVLLSIFCILLVRSLHISQKRRQRLLQQSHNNHESSRERTRDHARTTRMLLVVLSLFLFTELPQGILGLIMGVKDGIFEAVYIPLGDAFDIIALINNAINFILYCSMSKQFRDTFVRTFCCILQKEDPDKAVRFSLLISVYADEYIQ